MTRALLAALGLALVLLGVQTWRLDRVKSALDGSQDQASALAKRLAAADLDAQTVADQCAARVDAARTSARRIETIIEREVHVDPTGCAIRDLIPAGELRDALTPSALPAKPLHDRQESPAAPR